MPPVQAAQLDHQRILLRFQIQQALHSSPRCRTAPPGILQRDIPLQPIAYAMKSTSGENQKNAASEMLFRNQSEPRY